MQPIEEFGKGAGRTYGAPDPRTGLAYYGRGLVQLTWLANYLKAGTKLGVDLVYHPELALRPDIAAQILFRGMIEGWFTGRKLADYFGPGHSDPVGARHIINGVDCAALIAGYYSYFLAALQAAKALAPPAPAPAPVPAPTKPAPASPAPVVGLWGWLKSKVL